MNLINIVILFGHFIIGMYIGYLLFEKKTGSFSLRDMINSISNKTLFYKRILLFMLIILSISLPIILNQIKLPDDYYKTLIDIIIGMFGLGGLIHTFVLGNLLNDKSVLNKHKLDLEVQREIQRTTLGRTPKLYDNIINNVSTSIEDNHKKTKKSVKNVALSIYFSLMGLVLSLLLPRYNDAKIPTYILSRLFIHWLIFISILLNFYFIFDNIISLVDERDT